MKKKVFGTILLPVLATAGIISLVALKNDLKTAVTKSTRADAPANADLTVPAGFKAVMLIEDEGGARHIAVTPRNEIYVKLRAPEKGKGILLLHQNGDKAEVKMGFGDYGGTGIGIKNGYLYATSDEQVFRYKLNSNDEVIDPNKPELIVTGLIARGEHEPKAITLDNAGHVYVNIGAYSNACQVKDRQKGSPGRKGCPILDSAAGIWQFSASKPDQHYGDGVRYATGLRNVVGMDWNRQDNQLFVMQHGRDQLHDLFPQYYTTKESAELPAECMYAIKKGDNAGWPYMYYDQIKHEKMLMPEYGGDGKKTGGQNAINPVAAYPGHLAPDGLLFYTGNQFPARYKNGAFIAFHGSWNRAPEPQAGYFVVFQPFRNGRPYGKWEVFADGFAGTAEDKAKGNAMHRPCGLAQGPDGSLYVSDDSRGAIYKITYKK
ncbi:MAG TPA: PQQ-dependent sugar dehydrogenase [Mucilaginibacter sp.]|nr:PQQ-dependent sugar dehydrogenase [Mucilaginibacter sp.]